MWFEYDEGKQIVKWKHNYGLSVVAFVTPGTPLHTALIQAQNCVKSILDTAWKPISADRLHMTIAGVDINSALNACRTEKLGADVLAARDAFVAEAVSSHTRFAVSFEEPFQSPADGRFNVAGIPVRDADEITLMTLRRQLASQSRIVHIGLGSVVSPIRADCFRQIHCRLSGISWCGTLDVTTLFLVHHPTDHFVLSDSEPGDIEDMKVKSYDLL
jgi:hypothetical protein